MSYQQIREVVSLPPDPPRLTNNNYICKESCPKRLDQHISALHSNASRALQTVGLFEHLQKNKKEEYNRHKNVFSWFHIDDFVSFSLIPIGKI